MYAHLLLDTTLTLGWAQRSLLRTYVRIWRLSVSTAASLQTKLVEPTPATVVYFLAYLQKGAFVLLLFI
jgi:hypothetical protein